MSYTRVHNDDGEDDDGDGDDTTAADDDDTIHSSPCGVARVVRAIVHVYIMCDRSYQHVMAYIVRCARTIGAV